MIYFHAFCQLKQLSLEGQALSKINKGNWAKAEQLLRKSLKKNTINPEARYVFSTLFLLPAYPKYNIDSAHFYGLQLMTDYNRSTLREKEKLKRFPLDSSIIVTLLKKIESEAFGVASTIHTESDYNEFLEKYTDASEVRKAIELRDEVAYSDALRLNTYQSFQHYLNKYPKSLRAADAHNLYEKLIYEDKTRDGKLKSFVAFLDNYPTTVYRNEVEKIIFEITTASGEPSAFQAFTKAYPKSKQVKKAIDLLYYLNDESQIPEIVTNDSLQATAKLKKGYWVPILKGDKFGFINQEGVEQLAPQFDGLDDAYACGNITTDYLITSAGLFSRSGKLILDTKAEAIEDLGLGFLKVKSTDCWRVVHESGFSLIDLCLQDAKVIASRFIAIKENAKWTLLTLAGRRLSPSTFEDIYAEDELIIFSKNGKRIPKSRQEIGACADGIAWSESLVFDNVKALGQNHYLVSNGSLQGVLSASLDYIVPLDRLIISQTPYGFLNQKNGKMQLTGISNEIDNQDFVDVKFYRNWIKLEEKNNLMLYDGKNKQTIETGLDSLWFKNGLAFTKKGDSLKVYLTTLNVIALEAASDIQFIKSTDSTQYFYSSRAKKKDVFEIATGKKLFSIKVNAIESIGEGIFLVDEEGKKGLINKSGKVLLPLEYSAIIPTRKNFISLLKDKKFGLYNVENKILIKPLYERNIIPYSENKLVAFKNGFFGFVSWNLKEESKFEFDEVQFWNDSVAIVKRNMSWQLYNIPQKKVVLDEIKDFHYIINQKEKIIIVHQAGYYGALSNTRGILLPITFSDIVNLGSPESPLYFTDKFYEEADIHVVVYYGSNGKLLRKQAYETKDYERIYCEE